MLLRDIWALLTEGSLLWPQFLSAANSDLPRCPSDRQRTATISSWQTVGPRPKEIFGRSGDLRRSVRDLKRATQRTPPEQPDWQLGSCSPPLQSDGERKGKHCNGHLARSSLRQAAER